MRRIDGKSSKFVEKAVVKWSTVCRRGDKLVLSPLQCYHVGGCKQV